MSRITASVVFGLVLLLAAAAPRAAEGELTLDQDRPEQQFFLSQHPTELTATVSATRGKILIYTKDAKGQVKELGQAVPSKPLKIKGAYDTLFARLPKDGAPAKGTFKLTFTKATEP